MSKLSTYKRIDDKMTSDLNIKLKRKYTYVYQENNVSRHVVVNEVPLDGTSSSYKLDDPSSLWDKNTSPINMSLELTINNANVLFGRKGVCEKDATLGLGIEYKSDSSPVMNKIYLGDIKNTTSVQCFNETIELYETNGNIVFNWVIFLKEDTITEQTYFAKRAGMVLGKDVLLTLCTGYSSPLFPLIEITETNKPLWSIKCDVSNIDNEPFNKNHVAVIVNSAHPMYNLLLNNEDQSILNEVFTSALTLLIVTLRQKSINHKIDLKKKGNSGSIKNTLIYFNDSLKFNVNGSTKALSESIKLYFDQGQNYANTMYQ